MRKFYIQAGNGLRYDLQDRNKCFLNSPKGLGFSKNNSYVNVGNYFTVDDSKNNQKSINGSLIFKGDWYANYKEFIEFIKNYSDYKLVYKYDENDYYIDIDIIGVEKGDTDKHTFLECGIEMKSKSLWYKQTSITRTIEQSEELPQWDWRFDLTFSDETFDKIGIDNQGQVETPFEFELFGVVEGITLDIYQNGEIINTITFDIDLSDGDSLLYGNKDNNLYVYIKSNETLTNAFDCLDLSNDNWTKLPVGETSLKFHTDMGTISSVTITYFEEYEAV